MRLRSVRQGDQRLVIHEGGVFVIIQQAYEPHSQYGKAYL